MNIKCWDAESGQLKQTLKMKPKLAMGYNAVIALSPDGHVLAVGSDENITL